GAKVHYGGFEDLFGQKGRQGAGFEDMFSGGEYQARGATPLKGQDVHSALNLTFQEVASGGEKKIKFQKGGKVEEVTVKIPPGIESGKKLRLAGKGMEGGRGVPPGDLYLQVNIADHPLFKREGSDLTLDKEIKISEALLGTTIEVPTLDGSKHIKVPPGTQSHSRIRLKGFGLPHFQGGGRGDEFVRILIKHPKSLTEKQKKLAEEMKKEGL
ncbi:MAG: HSP40/DnaJ peptide-binding protein, partial [Deltaproteobacteria bacterium]|nr:HSP40/DnaJ peptide-binding protein [Deltaproteobacteria bacterium]